jgi:integrase
MTRGVLQNYIKASPKTGRLSYRRRIPEKLKNHFTKPDGSTRGLEWNEKLDTKSISIALRKATVINERFERTKAMAQQLVIASEAENQPTQTQQLEDVVRYFRKIGIHPDQAPDIFAPAPKANAFLAKTAKAQRELMDFQEEVGIEVSGDPYDESYATNKQYDAIQAQIDFLNGDRSRIKDLLRPTWEVAVDEYINNKSKLENNPPNFRDRKDMKRVLRIASTFAASLGGSSIKVGNSYLLSEISREDARRWIEEQLQAGRTLPTVGRDSAALSAIYKTAQWEYQQKDPELGSRGNPFSGLRDELKKRDDLAVRKGQRIKSSARAWSPKELDQLKALLPAMNEEARLCVKLAMFTGARLKDVCGLMIDELELNGELDSAIRIEGNWWREVSKDSIERRVPLYGEMLEDLKAYVGRKDFSSDQKLTPRYAKTATSVDSLSNLLNQRYIDSFSKDPTLKPHGFRNTLQAKFDAADTPNKTSGYLIGWKNQDTVGMQKEYNKQGYPHLQLLQVLKACHAVEEWAS